MLAAEWNLVGSGVEDVVVAEEAVLFWPVAFEAVEG